MAHLIKYAMLNNERNAIAGNLVKAQCDICGKKYGSFEEAKKCENECMKRIINQFDLTKRSGK